MRGGRAVPIPGRPPAGARSRRGGAVLPVLLALLALPAHGRAQEVQASGFAEADHFEYLEGATAGHDNRSHRGMLHVRAVSRLHERLEVVTAGHLRGSCADGARGRAHLNEAFIGLLLPKADIRIGKQIIAWGKTDVLNPTDHLAPRDLSEPLDTDDERIGVLAAYARLDAGGIRADGVLAPGLTPSRLPAIGSRWFPALPPTMPHPLQPARNVAVSYRQLEASRPPLTLRGAQVALRLSTTRRGWDVSISYFDGWDDLPATREQVEFLADGQARVDLRHDHPRRRAVGGDLATTLGPYTVRAEGAYFMTSDSLAGPDHFQGVVGMERFFGDPLGAGSTLVLLQWIEGITPGDFVPDPFDLNHVFRRALTGRVQHNLTPDLQLTLEGLYDFEAKGYYLHPGVTYRLSGHLRLEAFSDLLGGSERGFFGAFAGNRRVQTSLRYSF